MELIAAINACKAFDEIDNFGTVTIYSDSAYLINCRNQNWWRAWQCNGWRNSKKEPVANQELWEQLIPYFEKPTKYNFVKVKGHNGDKSLKAYWNDVVDKMAVHKKQEMMGL